VCAVSVMERSSRRRAHRELLARCESSFHIRAYQISHASKSKLNTHPAQKAHSTDWSFMGLDRRGGFEQLFDLDHKRIITALVTTSLEIPKNKVIPLSLKLSLIKFLAVVR
jgi:hypothetical protein